MQARMTNPATVLPQATKGIQALYGAMYSGGASHRTLELVHLRVSQINGCSACVRAGSESAAKAGETTERLLDLPAWYESPLFDDAERAALAVAEASTRLADRPGQVTDALWAEFEKHHNEKQRAAIILMIATTNFFNRINTTIQEPAGTSWT